MLTYRFNYNGVCIFPISTTVFSIINRLLPPSCLDGPAVVVLQKPIKIRLIRSNAFANWLDFL